VNTQKMRSQRMGIGTYNDTRRRAGQTPPAKSA